MTDPATSNEKSTAPKNERHTLRSLLALLGILVVLISIPLIWAFVRDTEAPSEQVDSSVGLEAISDAMRQGDYESAVARLRAIQADESATADDKARAVIYSLGAGRALGDTGAVAADVLSLKASIVDEGVSPALKAALINKLVTQLSVSGNDPAINNLIFADAPFDSYRASGDDRKSLINLTMWSLETAPSAVAAITLARWHSQPSVPWAGGADAVTEASAQEALRFLTIADSRVDAESKDDPAYETRADFFFYRFWRAIIVGRLAEVLGEPYTSQVRAEFDGFLSFAEAHPAAWAREWLPFARYWYAASLLDDADTDASREQLDLLTEELAVITQRETNSFILNVRDQFKRRGEGWGTISALADLSPSFKTAIEGIIGEPIK